MTGEAHPTEPSAPAKAPSASRGPSAWDRTARWIALLLLVAISTVVYWVPLQLVGPWGAAFVLALLTIGFVSLSSRLLALRHRVADLEARAAHEDQK